MTDWNVAAIALNPTNLPTHRPGPTRDVGAVLVPALFLSNTDALPIRGSDNVANWQVEAIG